MVREYSITIKAGFLISARSLPPLAGLGADCLFQKIRRLSGRIPAAITTTIVLFLGAGSLFSMHPYQMSYFNALAGEPDTVHTRYETDYWVSSYKEGAEWINARQREAGRPLRVLVAANTLSARCALRYLDRRVKAYILFERTKSPTLPDGFDLYLSTVRYGLDQNFPKEEVVHSIKRNGILFAVIKGHPR